MHRPLLLWGPCALSGRPIQRMRSCALHAPWDRGRLARISMPVFPAPSQSTRHCRYKGIIEILIGNLLVLFGRFDINDRQLRSAQKANAWGNTAFHSQTSVHIQCSVLHFVEPSLILLSKL